MSAGNPCGRMIPSGLAEDCTGTPDADPAPGAGKYRSSEQKLPRREEWIREALKTCNWLIYDVDLASLRAVVFLTADPANRVLAYSYPTVRPIKLFNLAF